MAAGPAFNFMMAMVIFIGMMLVNGIATQEPVVGAVKAVPFDGQVLEPGDRILQVAGQDTPDLATRNAGQISRSAAAPVPV